MQVYGFLLSSLCLGGAHCELPLLAHTTAPNHAPVIHHHVSWPFLKKVAVSSSSLDYRVWHVSVKSGIVSSSFFACSYSWLLSPCKYIPRTLEPWAWMEQSERLSMWSTDLAYEWEGPVFLPQTFLWTPGIPGFSPLCIFCTWCFCVNKELLICNFQSAPIRLPWHYNCEKIKAAICSRLVYSS